MSIVRDPFRDLSKLQERMNQMFDQTFLRSDGREEEIQEGSWSPAVDIQETPDRIVLRADLPGISIEQIELKIENDRLTLKGERFSRAGRLTGCRSRCTTMKPVSTRRSRHTSGMVTRCWSE